MHENGMHAETKRQNKSVQYFPSAPSTLHYSRIIILGSLLKMEAAQEDDFGQCSHPPFKKIKRAHLADSKTILDLDDACLIHVFSFLNPLPDLFSAARACTVSKIIQTLIN